MPNSKKFRVLICGGREFPTDVPSLERASIQVAGILSELPRPPDKEDVVFISGMARGADQIPIFMVREDESWGGIMEFPADWNTHGRRAGPIRNIEMLTKGDPHLVIAFPSANSKGTWHMVDISKKSGKKVVIVENE